MSDSQAKPYGRFDFDLAAAVTDQLIAAFAALPIGELTPSLINEIDREQGVYQLYLGDTLMYVGKAEVPLPKRLEEHRWNFSGRRNIDMSQLGFKGLIIHKNWSTSVHEDILIRHYRTNGQCEWNLTGLGNHDPGRNREDTETPDDHFDAMYPIKQDYVPQGIEAGTWNATELLVALKDSLPFTFRYEATGHYRKGSPKYANIQIEIEHAGLNITELLTHIINAFPDGWQATFFPGRAILYEEDRNYSHSIKVIRKP